MKAITPVFGNLETTVGDIGRIRRNAKRRAATGQALKAKCAAKEMAAGARRKAKIKPQK